MTVNDLTPVQRQELLGRLVRHRNFYYQLRKRMDQLGWDVSDPTYLAAVAAEAATHDLVLAADGSGQYPRLAEGDGKGTEGGRISDLRFEI